MGTCFFYTPRGIELVLLVLLGWVAVNWYFQYNDTKLPVMEVMDNALEAENANVPNVAQLKVPLFGHQKLHHQHVITSTKPMVASALKIKLLGTVVAGKRSAAIIKVGKLTETTFFLGDSLQSGVFLKMVENDAIVVDNQGKFERVDLSKGAVIQKSKVRFSHNQPLVSQKRLLHGMSR